MDPEIQRRIQQLYADMKPLMDQYGMKPMTIQERYDRIQQRKSQEQQLLASYAALSKRKFPKL
jgi:hypothetical protein